MASAEHERIEILEKEIFNLRSENKEMKNELLWIIEEVWPLVYKLTSRETLKRRFLRLNDFMGKLPNGQC